MSVRRKPRILTAVLAFLAVLLASLCVLSWMLLSDPNAGTSMPEPSDAAVSKIVKAAASGGECSLTAEEVGGVLNEYLSKKPVHGVSAVSVAALDDHTVDLYFPVQYFGRRLGVLANVSPAFDSAAGEIRFTVRSVRIGRLPVSPKWVLDALGKQLPASFSRDGNVLSCGVPRFSASYAGVGVKLSMSDLKLENRLFQLKFRMELQFSA